MPRKPRTQAAALPTIAPELLESFGSGPMTAEAINAASLAFKKALIERALAGEMNHHLGYPAGGAKPVAVSNLRNGKGAKTALTEDGPIRAVTFCIDRKSPRYITGLTEAQIADVLSRATGSRGSMAEYLHATVDHLERLGIHDHHLWRLQELVADRIDTAYPTEP